MKIIIFYKLWISSMFRSWSAIASWKIESGTNNFTNKKKTRTSTTPVKERFARASASRATNPTITHIIRTATTTKRGSAQLGSSLGNVVYYSVFGNRYMIWFNKSLPLTSTRFACTEKVLGAVLLRWGFQFSNK